jgi:hypothetical protein
MKGQEIVFVDIYTQYMRTDGRIADFTKRDYENFKRTEQTGGIELEFQ